MLIYIVRRLFMLIPMLLGISIISFLVVCLSGDPVDVQYQLNQKVSLELKERIKEAEGFNQPLWQQYFRWLKGIIKFNFGISFIDRRPVIEKIRERIPITLTINILSLLIIFLIAIPIGVFSAVWEQSFFDRVMTVFVFIGFSLPTFWLALLLMQFFGVNLHWLPVSGIRSLEFEYFSMWGKFVDLARHLILPICLSAFTSLAGISRYMRTNMINVLKQDYIRTAYAKGLPKNRIYFRHALKNAILPIITILGLSVPGLIGGSVIFESIFGIPGMGKLAYDAVMSRDRYVIMGILIISSLLTLLGNFLADLAYCYADPRIRYESNNEK
ncbi:MAG: ABC transporter permease [Candidatus Omnitrophota bacterium]